MFLLHIKYVTNFRIHQEEYLTCIGKVHEYPSTRKASNTSISFAEVLHTSHTWTFTLDGLGAKYTCSPRR